MRKSPPDSWALLSASSEQKKVTREVSEGIRHQKAEDQDSGLGFTTTWWKSVYLPGFPFLISKIKTIINSKLPFSSDFLWLEIDKTVPCGHTVLDVWRETPKDFLSRGGDVCARGPSVSHIVLYSHSITIFWGLAVCLPFCSSRLYHSGQGWLVGLSVLSSYVTLGGTVHIVFQVNDTFVKWCAICALQFSFMKLSTSWGRRQWRKVIPVNKCYSLMGHYHGCCRCHMVLLPQMGRSAGLLLFWGPAGARRYPGCRRSVLGCHCQRTN